MKTHRIAVTTLGKRQFAFGESGEEKFFVPFSGRRKIEGTGKKKKFTDELDRDIRIQEGSVIVAVVEDQGGQYRCATQWTTEEIWTGKPAKKVVSVKKPTAKKPAEKTQPMPASAPAVKTPAVEKITDKDERMLRIRLVNPDGANPQAFYGKLSGLQRFVETEKLPKKDFKFEVQNATGAWVPADKEILGRLATKVVEKEPVAAVAA